MKMNIAKISLSLALLLVIPLLFNPTVSTATPIDYGGEVVFTTDELSIMVPTSEVPFYFYWSNEDPSIGYRVQFDAMYEVNDTNGNGEYELGIDTTYGDSFVALASLSWELSEVVNETVGTDEVTHFNLTGSNYESFTTPMDIQFRNHIVSSGGDTELKFDVVLNNYEWFMPGDETLLVLAYKIQSTDPAFDGSLDEGTDPETGEDRVDFANGYFESVPVASNTTGSEVSSAVKASVTTAGEDGNSKIYQSYTYFEGDLIHDPTIGLDSGHLSEPVATEKTVDAEGLTFRFPTNQVPFYFFGLSDSEDETYRVQFDAMFEVTDANSDGTYDQDSETMDGLSTIALAQMNWEFGGLVNTTDDDGNKVVSFDLTGTVPELNPSLPVNFELIFRNHITVNGDESNLKFDIVINNYEWSTAAEDTLLVLAYKVQSTSSSYEGVSQPASDSIEFGAGYFNSTNTASNSTGTDVSNTVTAGLSTGDSSGSGGTDADPRIYLAYSYFEGNLTHDPSLGIDSSDTTSDEDGDGDGDGDGDDAGLNGFTIVFSLAVLVTIPIMRKIRSNRR